MSTEEKEKVLSIIEKINNSQIDNTPSSDNNCKNPKNLKKKKIKTLENDSNLIRGKPKSGRFWKTKKDRFSSVIKTKGIRPDFQKKTALRLELQNTKKLSQQLKEDIQNKEILRKERRRENIKRNEENKRKSEIVQVITNSAKVKRMKKKQLRFIEKRDTNKNTIK